MNEAHLLHTHNHEYKISNLHKPLKEQKKLQVSIKVMEDPKRRATIVRIQSKEKETYEYHLYAL